MIASIKLTKKLIDGQDLIVTPNWVSNGHWALRRLLLENEYVLADPEKALGVDSKEGEDSLIENILKDVFSSENPPVRPARKTSWVKTHEVSWKRKPEEYCLFELDEPRVGIFFNRLYVESLDLEALWVSGGSTSPSVNAEKKEEVSILLMPANLGEVTILNRPIKTIMSLKDLED